MTIVTQLTYNQVIIRHIQNKIENSLFQGKAIIIYGARLVGKTTLLNQLRNNNPKPSLFLNCDEPDVRQKLTNVTSTQLKSLIRDNQFVYIDEAQRVKNIGLTIKLIVDNLAGVQVIATGSSSLDLSNEISEPLTGRKYEFNLFPFSWSEIQQIYSPTEATRLLENILICGSYPEILANGPNAESRLLEITTSYLYRDVLQYQQVRTADVLEKLLSALALQIGQEVSFNELSRLLEIDKKTVARYVDLLEKAFVIFRLKPFCRNLRQELNKMQKIYFCDLGIRNTIIRNLNPLNLRTDIGGIWENFIINERRKMLINDKPMVNTYFWRTHRQQEIDYLEEENTNLSAYEMKWNNQKAKPPSIFMSTYLNATFDTITKDNFIDFLK